MTPSPTFRLTIKVVPGATRNEIVGWLGEALKIRVRAAPERGQANDALVRVLAEALAVPTRRVRVVAGRTSARKTVEIAGLGEEEVRKRLLGP
jgi:uncharacterized protein (TIGR00251 family)